MCISLHTMVCTQVTHHDKCPRVRDSCGEKLRAAIYGMQFGGGYKENVGDMTQHKEATVATDKPVSTQITLRTFYTH